MQIANDNYTLVQRSQAYTNALHADFLTEQYPDDIIFRLYSKETWERYRLMGGRRHIPVSKTISKLRIIK